MAPTSNADLLVLLVSDDTRWRSACADICLARHCNVHTASTGFQGLDNLRKHRYDIVILDDTIDDLSAFEFHLHLQDLTSNDPAVLVAGSQIEAFLKLNPDGDEKQLALGTHASILEQIPPAIHRIEKNHVENAQR